MVNPGAGDRLVSQELTQASRMASVLVPAIIVAGVHGIRCTLLLRQSACHFLKRLSIF